MYKILASLFEDMNEGWVWVSDLDIPQRSIIKVTNKANKKSAYCEYLKIDENYTTRYNDSPRIFIDPSQKIINGNNIDINKNNRTSTPTLESNTRNL